VIRIAHQIVMITTAATDQMNAKSVLKGPIGTTTTKKESTTAEVEMIAVKMIALKTIVERMIV
jgi:hypothetical protein